MGLLLRIILVLCTLATRRIASRMIAELYQTKASDAFPS